MAGEAQIGFFILVAFIFVLAAKGLKIIRPWEKGLIERFGKYQRTVSSGLTLIVPFWERIIKVDMKKSHTTSLIIIMPQRNSRRQI
jgi:regulator of protease activity HflC (stomatin/prohibitin superfamily)